MPNSYCDTRGLALIYYIWEFTMYLKNFTRNKTSRKFFIIYYDSFWTVKTSWLTKVGFSSEAIFGDSPGLTIFMAFSGTLVQCEKLWSGMWKTVRERGTPPGAAAGRYFLFLCGLRGLRSTKIFRFSLKTWTGFVDSPLAQTAQIRPTTRKPESQVLLKPLQSAQNQEVSACRSPWRGSSSADS